MIILRTEETYRSPRSSSSLEIVIYSDEEGEITVDGEEEDESLPNHILPNGVLYEQENDDGLFEMEDIPSSNNSLQYNDTPSQVEMHVRYYVPTNEKPHGLSQSVIINDRDYLRRSIMNMRSSSNYNSHSSYHRQFVSVPEVEEDEDYEYNDYQNIGENDHSLYTVPFPETVNETIYSQSAPTTTRPFLFDLPNFLSSENDTAKEEEDEKIDDNNSTVGPGSVHSSNSSTGSIIHAIVLPQDEGQRDEEDTSVIPQQTGAASQPHDDDIVTLQEKEENETDDTNLLPHQQQKTDAHSPPPREEETIIINTPPQVSQDDESASYNCPSSPSSQDKASTERPPLPPQDESSTEDTQVQDEVATDKPLPQDETIITVSSSSQEPDIAEPSLKDEIISNYILSPDITAADVPLQKQPDDNSASGIPVSQQQDTFTLHSDILSQPDPSVFSGTTYQQNDTSSSTPQCHFPYQQDATTASFQQCIDNMLASYQKTEDEYTSWSKLASSHYRENSRIDNHHQSFYQQRVDDHNTTWERMHRGPDAYRQTTKNPFIFECIAQHAFSIKVTGLSKFARFKDIQTHFFDPNVVFIRYIRLIHCAYVMYRNYEEMVKAVARFNNSVVCGKPIYCRPSFYGELDRDNQLHSEIISRPPRPNSTIRYNNSNCKRRIAHRGRKDTFIPERHGIKQVVAVNGRPYQAPPINYCPPPAALYITTTTTTSTTTTNTNNKMSNTAKMSNANKMLSSYHPTQTVTTLTSYCRDVTINDHHRHYFTTIIPNAISCLTNMVQYVILKPWLLQDIRFSQINGYWSLNPRNAAVLNFLFNHTPQVNLIFHLRGSQAYQGYAVMKSEVMDLKALSNQEIFGTPFQRLGRYNKIANKSRVWRYVCKIEWKSRGKTSSKDTCEYMNSWNRNIPIKYSKDCTILEPNLGKKVVEKISSSAQN